MSIVVPGFNPCSIATVGLGLVLCSVTTLVSAAKSAISAVPTTDNNCGRLDSWQFQQISYPDFSKVVKECLGTSSSGNSEERAHLLQEINHFMAHGEYDNKLTPLEKAIIKKDLDVVRVLIENCANILFEGTEGSVPLILAISSRNLDIAKLLIENGADVNFRGRDGITPLLLASSSQKLDIAKLLIENGADVNSRDKDGIGPLTFAVVNKDLELVRLLIENGAKVIFKDIANFLVRVTDAENDSKLAQLLIEKAGNVNQKGIDGSTFLERAISAKNLEAAALLIKNGANINHEGKNGITALTFAMSQKDLKLVEWLIGKGADVNFRVGGGFTPLDMVISHKDLKIAGLLIRKGAHAKHLNALGFSIIFLDSFLSRIGFAVPQVIANFLL